MVDDHHGCNSNTRFIQHSGMDLSYPRSRVVGNIWLQAVLRHWPLLHNGIMGLLSSVNHRQTQGLASFSAFSRRRKQHHSRLSTLCWSHYDKSSQSQPTERAAEEGTRTHRRNQYISASPLHAPDKAFIGVILLQSSRLFVPYSVSESLLKCANDGTENASERHTSLS